MSEPVGRQIGCGTSADVFQLTGGRVLKLFFDSVPQSTSNLEFLASSWAKELGLEVARPLGWHALNGRRGIVFEEAPGELLLKFMRRVPLRAVPAIQALARYHAQIHRKQGNSTLPVLREVLRRDIMLSSAPDAARQAALTALETMPDGDSLCHGDFHPGNAFWCGGRLIAIDWSKAASGAAAADAARTELLIRYGQYGKMERRYRLLRLGRHWLAEWYLLEYCRRTGMPRAAIAAWRLPVAVAWQSRKAAQENAALTTAITRMASAA